MPVIRPTETSVAPIAFSLKDIERQAQALLVRARQRAESLLKEALETAESLRSQAKTEGFAEGREQGVAAAFAQGLIDGKAQATAAHQAALSQVTQALASAAGQLEAAKQDLLGNSLVDVIELSTAIARKVTKRQAAIDPAVLTENVREALRLTVHASDIHIVLNPAQRQVLLDELPALQRHYANLKHVELLDDPSIEVGGCRLITRHGEVEAEIDKQLDRVIAELMPEEKEPRGLVASATR